MNLSTMLQQRAAGGRPVRIGLIGAGKFGSMVLAQAQRIPGFHVVGVADLDVGKARASMRRRSALRRRSRFENLIPAQSATAKALSARTNFASQSKQSASTGSV